MNFLRVRRLHFVGIGGIGMSGLAELLRAMGFSVSGSDLKESEATERLRSLGIAVFPAVPPAPHARGRALALYSLAARPVPSRGSTSLSPAVPDVQRSPINCAPR